MSIHFTKMHALGNDFMVIDALSQSIHLTSKQIAALSDRHTGIGFDQCLLIEKSADPSIDFFYRIINADGSEVGQCANGARCLARFVHHYKLSNKPNIRIATRTTTMQLTHHDDDSVTVMLEKPSTDLKRIPLLATNLSEHYEIALDNKTSVAVHALSVGNPHAIHVVNELDAIQTEYIGAQINQNPLFPEQCNVSCMKIINPGCIALQVYERGTGMTKACGSAAVAAAAAGILFHQLNHEVEVQLPGGTLSVAWPNLEGPIYLTGTASFVYEGRLSGLH